MAHSPGDVKTFHDFLFQFWLAIIYWPPEYGLFWPPA
jgi:hypothetical protein